MTSAHRLEPTGKYEIGFRDLAKVRAAAQGEEVRWIDKEFSSHHHKFRCLLEQLTGGTEYEVRVRAEYEAGWSRWAAPLRATTTPV